MKTKRDKTRQDKTKRVVNEPHQLEPKEYNQINK